jgi:hypothetical protein
MALDLATALTRTAGMLSDASNALWSTTDLTNALRLALGEMSLAARTALTLKDLDTAAATTVPAILENALIVGGAAYAASSRQVDKADFEVLTEAKDLTPWVVARMTDFRRMLSMQYPGSLPEDGTGVSGSSKFEEPPAWEKTRLAGLRASSNPYAHWDDDFGEKSNE